jgi:hypothetical protein
MIFPVNLPETGIMMSKTRKNAVANYRRRMRRLGLVRVEVQVRREDAPLVRDLVSALADPAQARAARALLRERFRPRAAKSLKALLAEAPLDGIEIERDRDTGRAVDL